MGITVPHPNYSYLYLFTSTSCNSSNTEIWSANTGFYLEKNVTVNQNYSYYYCFICIASTVDEIHSFPGFIKIERIQSCNL